MSAIGGAPTRQATRFAGVSGSVLLSLIDGGGSEQDVNDLGVQCWIMAKALRGPVNQELSLGGERIQVRQEQAGGILTEPIQKKAKTYGPAPLRGYYAWQMEDCPSCDANNLDEVLGWPRPTAESESWDSGNPYQETAAKSSPSRDTNNDS
jgi:hypothetical protein